VHQDGIRVLVWSDTSDEVRAWLRRLPGVRAVSGACTLHGAWRATTSSQPDALIVATTSAGADTLALAHRISPERRPLFIVVSDRSADARAAFEIGAVDCFAPGRFDSRIHEALRRVRDRRAEERLAQQVVQFARTLMADASLPEDETPTLEVSDRGARLTIRISDVEVVQSCRNYVRIATLEHEYVLRATLMRCAAMLRAGGFVRVHRRYLVNVRWIAGLGPAGEVWLQSGRVVPSGRVFRAGAAARFAIERRRRAPARTSELRAGPNAEAIFTGRA
jgi:DNA-binding LytR/AlgR family response regulator